MTTELPPLFPVTGAPRTETVVYGSNGLVWGAPHARPRIVLPDLDSADANPREHRDGMLTVAAAVIYTDADGSRDLGMLCASPAHVLELALVVESQALRALEFEEQLLLARQQLATAQALGAEYQRQLDACRALLAEAQTLRAAALEEANQQRKLAVSLSEQVSALIRPPLPRLTGYGAPAQWDTSDCDTVVMDVGGGA